jgi:hypothetical protein
MPEFRYLSDVGRDPPRFIARKQISGAAPTGLLLEINVGKRLPIEVAHDKARVGFFSSPRRRKAERSGHHVSPVQCRAVSKISKAPGINQERA